MISYRNRSAWAARSNLLLRWSNIGESKAVEHWLRSGQVSGVRGTSWGLPQAKPWTRCKGRRPQEAPSSALGLWHCLRLFPTGAPLYQSRHSVPVERLANCCAWLTQSLHQYLFGSVTTRRHGPRPQHCRSNLTVEDTRLSHFSFNRYLQNPLLPPTFLTPCRFLRVFPHEIPVTTCKMKAQRKITFFNLAVRLTKG